jgi:hypothetical protein
MKVYHVIVEPEDAWYVPARWKTRAFSLRDARSTK